MGFVIHEDSIVLNFDNNTDAAERCKKEKEYLDYINQHIKLVKKAFVLYFAPLFYKNNISPLISDKELKQAIQDLAKVIDTHDASKFGDAEFDGYRAYYYPTSREKAGDDSFKADLEERYNECWKHHYETNDHHPKHWVDTETGIPRDMSLKAIIEMICDWESMALKFDSDTIKWYEEEAEDEKKCMSTNTKQIVEELLYNVLHK